MTKTNRLIARLTNDLRELAADLEGLPVEASEILWREIVVAKQSLGRGIRIERLELASEFLGIYLEREQLIERLNRLRSSPQTSVNEGEGVFAGLATELLEDVSLVRLLGAKLWIGSGLRAIADDYSNARDSEDDWEDSLADDLFNVTVEAQRELAVAEKVAACDGVGVEIPVSGDVQAPVVEIPGVTLSAAKIQQQAMLDGLDPKAFRALVRWFRSYRRATLNYTWLESQQNSETPINNLFTMMTTNELNPLGWLRQLSNHPEYRELDDSTFGIWNTLQELFDQMDFDDIIEDLKDGVPSFGGDSDDRINIIPGDEKVACKPVLLAFSNGSGKRGKFGFDNVMHGVKKHLIDCQDIVKLVVFVTDTWDSRKFMDDHFDELSSWRAKDDVRFLFLGVGAPRDQLSQIAVDLT